ncbi:hypothetical protein D3C76_1432940 [compost metagenome]
MIPEMKLRPSLTITLNPISWASLFNKRNVGSNIFCFVDRGSLYKEPILPGESEEGVIDMSLLET